MKTKILTPSSSAYEYPLLVKQLLTSPQRYECRNQIVYRGDLRFSYAEFNERVCRLANALTGLGVKAGDTVDITIWDAEGKPLPHDGESTGEVVARVPWLTQSYLYEPQKGDELWAIPKTIQIVDDIPKTSVGKIDKKRIRALLA